MNILVLVKQVPNTTEIKIDPKTGTLNRQGAVSIMNPDDKAALELALRIKEATDGKITVISMGPPQAKKVIVESIAMGADYGYLLSDFAFAGADTLATSTALSALIKTLDYDLIVAGRQAIDGDTAQVGPQIAEMLDIPQVSYVEGVEVLDGKVLAKRVMEDRYQIFRLEEKALLTVTSGAHIAPRYTNMNYLMEVTEDLDKYIETKTSKDLDVKLEQLGLKGSPTQVNKTASRELSVKQPPVEVEPEEAVKLIINKLKEKHVL